MSEYQYYEFQVIDRPLTKAEQEMLRDLSTRARITATSFTNHYEWGDLKGDPKRLMESFFDLHLYLAKTDLLVRLMEGDGPAPSARSPSTPRSGSFPTTTAPMTTPRHSASSSATPASVTPGMPGRMATTRNTISASVSTTRAFPSPSPPPFSRPRRGIGRDSSGTGGGRDELLRLV